MSSNTCWSTPALLGAHVIQVGHIEQPLRPDVAGQDILPEPGGRLRGVRKVEVLRRAGVPHLELIELRVRPVVDRADPAVTAGAGRLRLQRIPKLHQEQAKMVLAAASRHPPVGITPGVELDQLGRARGQQGFPQLGIRKLGPKDLPHHPNAGLVPVLPEGLQNRARKAGSWNLAAWKAASEHWKVSPW
jgi:hypothetical protein